MIEEFSLVKNEIASRVFVIIEKMFSLNLFQSSVEY
jgi:hypothetical protein